MTPKETAKFWMRVDGSTDFQCWNWKGVKNGQGYGRIADKGRTRMAHRIAYELVNGPIPKGLILRHRCDNRLCCNPEHLEPGTYQDNSDDMVRRKRSAAGMRNGRTRLTDEQIKAIRRNEGGLTLTELAAKYGIAESTTSYIRSGRSWKYLK